MESDIADKLKTIAGVEREKTQIVNLNEQMQQ